MTRKTPPNSAFGPWIVFCAGALLGGLTLDFALDARGDFWIAEQGGAAAMTGAAVASACIALAWLAKVVFDRNKASKGGDDAGADA
jgi:hypothetical protein